MKGQILTLAAASAVLAGVLACDKAPNPVSPAGTVLVISASPTSIALSGQGATVTVTGTRPDGNRIQAGTQINFTTTRGALHPAGDNCSSTTVASIVEADNRGQAAVLLCGDGRPGDATVRAALLNNRPGSGGGTGGGGGGSTTDAVEVVIAIGSPDTSRPQLVISANPTTIAVNATSAITFIARNSDGTPASSGARIRVTTDLGTLQCSNTYRCAGDPVNSCIAVCVDALGEATATFRAAGRAGTGKVTGVLGTAAPVSLDVSIRDAPAAFSFVTNRTTVTASAPELITLTVTVLNSQGSTISGVSVIFEVKDGVGGTLMPSSGVAVTGSGGLATGSFLANASSLVGRDRFRISARVVGEGAPLPAQEISIEVD